MVEILLCKKKRRRRKKKNARKGTMSAVSFAGTDADTTKTRPERLRQKAACRRNLKPATGKAIPCTKTKGVTAFPAQFMSRVSIPVLQCLFVPLVHRSHRQIWLTRDKRESPIAQSGPTKSLLLIAQSELRRGSSAIPEYVPVRDPCLLQTEETTGCRGQAVRARRVWSYFLQQT